VTHTLTRALEHTIAWCDAAAANCETRLEVEKRLDLQFTLSSSHILDSERVCHDLRPHARDGRGWRQ